MIDVSRLYIARPRFAPGSAAAYAFAAVIMAGAIALRLVLGGWFHDTPFVPFLPAVAVVAFFCGSRPALLVALLSALSVWLVFPPELSFAAIVRTVLFGLFAATVVAVLAGMRTVTANVQRLNETLRGSEEKFRGLLESAPDAMVIVDEHGCITLINARTEQLFGYGRAELLGADIELLIHEDDRAEYLARLAALVNELKTDSADDTIDLRGLRKDGSEFSIEVGLAPLKTASGMLVSSAMRDVTARRRVEAGVADASKAKSDFLASMSHELRTPLNAIIGFSEMIRDAVAGPLNAQYQEYAGDVAIAGRHLQNIINDILDISKIETGHLELREEVTSIGEIIDGCGRIVAAMADSASVKLAFDISESLPLIRADQVRFKQILLNLMSNAVKFTPAGGRVSISALSDDDGITIMVEDTGIGMKPADIVVALQPFRQIDGALSRRFDGTGLGLPLAKALVELHGGCLDIESTPSVGTTIFIRLPQDRILAAA